MNPNSPQQWLPQQQPPQPQPQPQQAQATPPVQPAQPLTEDYSIDYLNQIAPPMKQSQKPGKLLLIIFILVGLLIVVGIAALLLSGRPTSLDNASALSARMETLAKLSKDQHKNLRDNELRTTNTAYTLFLSNAVSDLSAPLEAAGIKKETTKAITASETAFATELTAKFEDARLNVVLDRTYAREMAYQLDIIEAMMRSIYGSTSSQQLQSYLDTANKNLAPIAQDFDEFATK